MLIHAAKQAVIIRPRDIAAIQTAIPHSRRVTVQGHQMLAIPHRVDETRVLRNLGCRVPSPILSYYDWPRSSEIKAPFLAQRATAAFMTLNPRAHIHNGLGSGKSLATLWAYDYLRSAQLVRSMLVIAPLSTLTPTWAESIEDHFPHLRVVVLYGTKQTRLKLLELPADIYVVNHDGAVVLRDNLAAKREIDVVVVDEIASAARNPRTNRWKAINAIINAKRVPIRWGWGLTGTPIPNEPTDAYGQAKLLTPETAPKYYNKFRDSVMKQVSQFRWVARPEALDVVKQVLTPAIRFSREECVDLPPTTYTDRLVPLSTRQQHAYDEMRTRLVAECAEGKIVAVNEAVKASKLLQIATGVAYDAHGEEHSFDAESRLKEVLALVQASESKTLVFVPFVSAVGLVSNYLESKGVSTERIFGAVSKADRDRAFGLFQHTDMPHVLVCQPAAMSHGLTLTRASTIVWYAPTMSAETYEQANGRITRPGQTYNTLIVHVGGTDIERRIYTRLKHKQSMQGVLLDMIRRDRE